MGRFGFRGAASLQRAALSCLTIALSALLWPLAASLVAGVSLITLTGVLEGPAYSGMIALRQRPAPPAVRAQVMTTLNSFGGVAISAESAVGGLVSSPVDLIFILVAVTFVAAASCGLRRGADA